MHALVFIDMLYLFESSGAMHEIGAGGGGGQGVLLSGSVSWFMSA
jgi:hypothetical protein